MRGSLLGTYRCLLCILSRAREGLFAGVLWGGPYNCACLAHHAHRIIVQEKVVGTRQINTQATSQMAHALAHQRSQDSSIRSAVRAFANVNSSLSLLFEVAVTAFAVGIPNLHSLGLCTHQAL